MILYPAIKKEQSRFDTRLLQPRKQLGEKIHLIIRLLNK